MDMKHKLFFLTIMVAALLATMSSSAQDQKVAANLPVDPESKKILYRAVVEEPGTPLYLYDKAIGWFGYYYANPQTVYSVQDKVNGKIEGQGRMKIVYFDEKEGFNRDAGMILYQIKLELKENKYRYTFTDFNLKGASRFPIEKWMDKTNPAYNANWDSFLYQVDTTMQRLVTTLKEKMKPTVIKKDEW
jgi:hypothetical protein